LERARAEHAAKAAEVKTDPGAFYRTWPLPESERRVLARDAGPMTVRFSYREGVLDLDDVGATWTSVTCGVDESEEVVVPLVVSGAERSRLRAQVDRMRFLDYRMWPACPWRRGKRESVPYLSVSIGARSNDVYWRHQGYQEGSCAQPGDDLAKLMRMLAEIIEPGIADAKLPTPKCGRL
jgi:hypothetical protein